MYTSVSVHVSMCVRVRKCGSSKIVWHVEQRLVGLEHTLSAPPNTAQQRGAGALHADASTTSRSIA